MADHHQIISGGGNIMVNVREYRKGNWTVGETMVLIEAKRMDDERRMKRSSDGSEGRSSKPAELRWKWVEDYCWRKGCLRSQNQCNDKWDNLMRDYKKVRDYERRLVAVVVETNTTNNNGERSYWKLDKNERKERNLPSNMLFEIYEALVEVVEKRSGIQIQTQTQKMLIASGSGDASPSSIPNITYTATTTTTTSNLPLPPPSSLPPLLQHQQQQHQVLVTTAFPSLHLPQPPPPLQPPPPYAQPFSTMCDDSDSDTNGYSDQSSPAKRRRRGGININAAGPSTSQQQQQQQEQNQYNFNEVSTAISKSASMIAEVIHACEDREEKRHRDLLSLHERRLKIEETKTEINRQGINGLVDSINKLAHSILTLASSHKNNQSPPQ